jgi:hypothetical protein
MRSVVSLTKSNGVVKHHHSSYVSQHKDHICVRYIMVMYEKTKIFSIGYTTVLKAIFKWETASYTLGNVVFIYELKLPIMKPGNALNVLICL